MKRELDERIADWVDGRLSPRDLERLEAEFRVNGSLRRAAEEYRRSVEHVRRALAKPEPPVELADRVLEKIQLRGAGPRLGKMLPMLASVAAAAAMVLLFVTLNQLEPAGNGSVRTSASANPEPADSPMSVLLEEITDADRDMFANQPQRESEFAARVQTGAEPEQQLQRQEQAKTETRSEERDKLLEQTGEVEAARKAAGIALDDKAGVDGPRPDGEIDAMAGLTVPSPVAVAADPDGVAAVPLDEGALWVQSIISDAEVQTADEQGQAEQREAEQKEAERRLGEGLPSLTEERVAGNRAAVAPSTPVVVIDLPPGQNLKPDTLGVSIVGGMTGAGIANRARRAPPAEEKNTAEVSRAEQLKKQAFQETLERALLPMSNAGSPDVEEFDGNGLVTLQGTLSFDDLAQKDSVAMGFARELRGMSADRSGDRGFLVQGERQQVAAFLREMADWGRAQGGQVGIAQVAETVVLQAQLQQTLSQVRLPGSAGAGGERSDLDRRQRDLLESLQVASGQAGRRGGRGRPAAPTVEEISVVLLFRTAR